MLTVGTDSFISVVDADTYWENHSGGDNWAVATTPEKEAALRESTQYIDKSYSWRGDHSGLESEPLSWPRYNVVDRQGRTRSSSEIPQEIKDATAWLADQALGGSLLQVKDRGGRISNLKAGSVEIQYEKGAPAQKQYHQVDLLISDLTRGGRNSTVLLKA